MRNKGLVQRWNKDIVIECYLDIANKWIKQWALCHYGDNCFCRKCVALYELMWMKVVINLSNSVPPLENRTPFLFTMCRRYFWMKTRTNNTSVSVSALSQGIISTSFRVFPRILVFLSQSWLKSKTFLIKGNVCYKVSLWILHTAP